MPETYHIIVEFNSQRYTLQMIYGASLYHHPDKKFWICAGEGFKSIRKSSNWGVSEDPYRAIRNYFMRYLPEKNKRAAIEKLKNMNPQRTVFSADELFEATR